jgi:hypothetical protein
MGHLSDLQKSFGKRGFNVLAITQESRETVLKFLAQLNTSPIEYTMGVGGGAGGFKTAGIPHAWLVSADGKVVWEGSPSGLPEKTIDAELKKVEKANPEKMAEKAGKSLAYAEDLAKDHRYLQAVEVLQKVMARYKGTDSEKQAKDRIAAIESDQASAQDLAAQRALAKIVGGSEIPKDKLKDKERKSAASRIEAFIKQNTDKNPGAAALAQVWLVVMNEDWTAHK